MDALPEKLDTGSQLLELTPKQLEVLAYKAAVQVVSLPKEKRKGGDTGKVAIGLTIAKMEEILSNRSTILDRIENEHNPSAIKGTAPGLAKAVLTELNSRRAMVSQASDQTSGEAIAPVAARQEAGDRSEKIQPELPSGPPPRPENTDMKALEEELDAELSAGYAPLAARSAKAFHELSTRRQLALACQAISEMSQRGISPTSFRSMVERQNEQSRVAEHMLGLHKGGQEYDEAALTKSDHYLRNADERTVAFINRCVDCAVAVSRLATPEQQLLIPDRYSIASERPYRGR